jgi:hypothetical protein
MYCSHFSGVNGDSTYCNTFDFILGLVAMGSLTGANREFLIALQSFQDYFGTFEQFNSVLSPVISVFKFCTLPTVFIYILFLYPD